MGENTINITKGKKTKEIATILKCETINQHGIKKKKKKTVVPVNVMVLNCCVIGPKLFFFTLNSNYKTK